MPCILSQKSNFIGFGKQVTKGWKPQIWTVDCPTDSLELTNLSPFTYSTNLIHNHTVLW